MDGTAFTDWIGVLEATGRMTRPDGEKIRDLRRRFEDGAWWREHGMPPADPGEQIVVGLMHRYVRPLLFQSVGQLLEQTPNEPLYFEVVSVEEWGSRYVN